ncbi:MAG: 2-amino-4-hydroxy-6-hydroxymethyldihydropteridine diphosphokinase [bacterium]
MKPGRETSGSPERLCRAHIGLGSNLDPETNILRAVPEIASRMKILAASRFYRTPPFHPSGHSQPPFINGVLQVEVSLDPWALKFQVLREIERKTGRIRSGDPYAPRTLDLDLLVVEGLRIESERLTLPDPAIFVHAFWAVPLAELLPDLPVPGAARTLGETALQMQSGDLVYVEGLTRDVRLRSGLPTDSAAEVTRGFP